MGAISASSLLTLEAYAKQRNEIRSRVLAHKKNRTVHLGANLTLIFEDETTVRYQIQEMLRIERTFDEKGIQDELDAYNPLIPNGTNLKATMMLEYENAVERARELSRLIGIERRVYLQVEGCEPCFGIADEDLVRENEEKTSSVHFLRFELAPQAISGFRAGRRVSIGVDHPRYRARVDAIEPGTQESLGRDFA